MWRRFSVLPTILPLIGLTVMADAARAADTPNVQLLLERLRVLEERLNKLEGSEGSKQVVRTMLFIDLEAKGDALCGDTSCL